MNASATAQAKTDRDSPAHFPRLVFKSAGWLLGCWGDHVIDDDVTDERRTELIAKLPALQSAIAAGTETGALEFVPREIVAHEYEVVKRSLDAVFRDVPKKRAERRSQVLKDATCDYQVQLSPTEPCVSRQLFFSKSADDVERLARNIATRSVQRATLAKELTAELFAIGVNRVEKRASRVRKEGDRFYAVPKEGQRFLVACFMMLARHGNDCRTEPRLLYILDALFRSGYDAKGLYHIARRINTMSEEEINSSAWQCKPEVCWEDVEAVRDYLRRHVHQRQGGYPAEDNDGGVTQGGC